MPSNFAPDQPSLVKTPEEIDGDVRMNNCLIDIRKALTRWNCKINPIIELSGFGSRATFQVVPLKNTIGGN